MNSEKVGRGGGGVWWGSSQDTCSGPVILPAVQALHSNESGVCVCVPVSVRCFYMYSIIHVHCTKIKLTDGRRRDQVDPLGRLDTRAFSLARRLGTRHITSHNIVWFSLYPPPWAGCTNK